MRMTFSTSCTELKSVKFYLFLVNLVAMITPVASSPKSYCLHEKFLDFLDRTEIRAILVYFCLNLFVLATSLAPWKM